MAIDPATGMAIQEGDDKPYLGPGNYFETSGIVPSLWVGVSYNRMQWPNTPLQQAVATGYFQQSWPNPISGIGIQLPDGSLTTAALRWTEAAEQSSGRYRIGAFNYGESVNGNLVYDWNASRIKLAAGYRLYVGASAGIIASDDLIAVQSATGRAVGTTQSTLASSFSGWATKGDLGNHIEMTITNSTFVDPYGILTAGDSELCMTRTDASWGTNVRAMWLRNDNGVIKFASTLTYVMSVSSTGLTLISPATLTMSAMAAGCIVYTGTAGLITIESTNLLWDNTNKVGTFGNMEIGAWPFLAGRAYIAYKGFNQAVNGNFGFVMNSSGDIQLNAVTGRGLYLGLAGVAYAAFISNAFGVGTFTPRKLVDILDTTAAQLRLTYTDNSVYTDLQTNSSGYFVVAPSGNLSFVEKTAVGTDVQHITSNLDNTNGSSNAIFQARVAGASGGDPVCIFYNTGAATGWTIGMDNSDSDNFKLASGTSLPATGILNIQGAGNVGINTAGPDRRLDVLDGTNPQMRLTFTDGSVYTDFQTDSSGRLVLSPSGTGGQVLFAAGAVATPSVSFSGQPTWGLYTTGGGLNVSVASTLQCQFSNGAVYLASIVGVGTGADCLLNRDAANVMSLKNSNTAQEFRVYAGNGSYTSTLKCVNESLTIAAAASTDSATSIPAGSIIVAVAVRVTTVIPTAVTFTVTTAVGGTAMNTAAVSTAAGTTDKGTAGGVFYQAAATAVRITPNAVPATATGVVRLAIYYYDVVAPTS